MARRRKLIPRDEARVRYKLDELGFVAFVRVEPASVPLKLHWQEMDPALPLLGAPAWLALAHSFAGGNVVRRLIVELCCVEGMAAELREELGLDV